MIFYPLCASMLMGVALLLMIWIDTPLDRAAFAKAALMAVLLAMPAAHGVAAGLLRQSVAAK